MKSLSITTVLILLAFFLNAQPKKMRFSSINQLGLISASKGEAWTLQTINGVRKNTWFAGVGAGLDFYGERSVPLFLDVRKDLTSNRNTPFAYADGGVNFEWLNTTEKALKQFPKTSPGAFYDLGLGWKLSGKNKRGVLFSAGYNFKKVIEKIPAPWLAPTSQLQADSYLKYNYLYRRFVIKFGLEL